MALKQKTTHRKATKANASRRLKRKAVELLDGRADHMITVARKIWENPELSLEEHRTAALLVKELEEAEFAVKTGVAEMPTAFVAQWGKGGPTIGIIAEYDAVPNCGRRKTDNGHGCGHNLFGTASVSAGIAVKAVLEKEGLKGTVKVFGTPAEETLFGKVKMVKAGLFKGLDAVLTWHPGDGTHSDYGSFMAMDSITFEFFGESAHAQIDPEKGRSALQALELMNEGVNRLRGQVPAATGINYVICEGGTSPIVVLPYAKSWYMIWTPSRTQTEAVTEEVKRIARGAAKATATRVKMNLVTGTYHRLPNVALGELIDKNLRWIGAPRFTRAEKTFARKLGFKDPLVEWVEPARKDYLMSVSNDQCNVSWLAPLGLFRTTCRAPNTPQHHWLATAQYGSGIGWKGMQIAAKSIACTALDLFSQPSTLGKVRKEFQKKTRGFVYRSPI
jgi:aminobenzoyl-glutamate utilization protein B